MSIKLSGLVGVAVLLSTLMPVGVNAATVPVTSLAGLGTVTDAISWGTLGAPFTLVTNPFVISSDGGLTVTVSQASGTFQRRDQGVAGGWNGNFSPGEQLLWTRTGTGPMLFDFGAPIVGFGLQINDNSASPGSATLIARDVNDALLATYSFSITATNNPAGASFIGILADSAIIGSISINTTLGNFAVGEVSLVRTAAPVPEPGALTLAALALFGWSRRRARPLV